MVVQGEVRNGVIVLPTEVLLPEGQQVQVIIPAPNVPSEAKPCDPPYGDSLRKFAGLCTDMPEDASQNVDHYLYGHPKR